MNRTDTIISLLVILACLNLSAQESTWPAGDPAVHSEQLNRNGDGKLGPGDHTRTIQVDELTRQYVFHIPAKYDSAKPTPVIVTFHGGGGNPQSMIRLTGLNAKSDEAGFVVVYPFGTGRLANTLLTFNGGECCGYAMENKVDDVGFTRELLDDLANVGNRCQARMVLSA